MSTSFRRKRDSRGSYHHGELRAAILQAAGELLEERGGADLSLREAARRAGVSHNAPYRHFADRDALLAALAAQGFARLDEALAAAAGGPRARGEAYVQFALRNPARFRLMFGGLLPLDAYPALRAAAAQTYAGLLRAFEAVTGASGAPIAAAAAWSLTHGLAQLLLDGHFSQLPRGEAAVAAFVREVLGAVRLARAR
ncbi:MAG TPA: TetR/AcrR family transcriptional regulator [Burkholderiales bacterium]|nr:TetR/AcrR family transcriptional regulator [Burkholderiales bacterium]